MKTQVRLVVAAFGLVMFTVSNATVQAEDYLYETNNGTITITGYTGLGGDVSIPSTINGQPVTSIGDRAFFQNTSLTDITIPNSVTTIGNSAFGSCSSLNSVKIPERVTSIGNSAFSGCTGLSSVIIPNSVTAIPTSMLSSCVSLTSLTIPDSVTTIGDWAFNNTSLTDVTIPSGVTSIGSRAFYSCSSLMAVYFQGNAPSAGQAVFQNVTTATVYYLPGARGWGTTFGGLPTGLWTLPYPIILTTAPNFGIQTNTFGFRISWTTNASVVVEGSTTLANPVWSPVSTNSLSNGWTYFSDAEWTNYPARFYRVRSE